MIPPRTVWFPERMYRTVPVPAVNVPLFVNVAALRSSVCAAVNVIAPAPLRIPVTATVPVPPRVSVLPAAGAVKLGCAVLALLSTTAGPAVCVHWKLAPVVGVDEAWSVAPCVPFALKMPTADPVYQKGVQYLRQTQAADGTWHVKTRSIPVQPYFESGFPYGHDQWISAAGTSWAAMALTLTIEPQKMSRR